jgi:hypothetical protein
MKVAGCSETLVLHPITLQGATAQETATLKTKQQQLQTLDTLFLSAVEEMLLLFLIASCGRLLKLKIFVLLCTVVWVAGLRMQRDPFTACNSVHVAKCDSSYNINMAAFTSRSVTLYKTVLFYISTKYSIQRGPGRECTKKKKQEYITQSKSRNSSVGIVLGYELDEPGSRVPFPAEAENFSLHHRVQNGSGTHPASYPMGTGDAFPGGKAAGA